MPLDAYIKSSNFKERHGIPDFRLERRNPNYLVPEADGTAHASAAAYPCLVGIIRDGSFPKIDILVVAFLLLYR